MLFIVIANMDFKYYICTLNPFAYEKSYFNHCILAFYIDF